MKAGVGISLRTASQRRVVCTLVLSQELEFAKWKNFLDGANSIFSGTNGGLGVASASQGA